MTKINMVRFYYDPSNNSSRKAMEWFKKLGIEISILKIQYISKEDLLNILYLSEQGFSDILKRKGKSKPNLEKMKREVMNMKFSEGVDFILNHTELLRIPIIIDEKKLLIGFHSVEIRKFTPRSYRNLDRN